MIAQKVMFDTMLHDHPVLAEAMLEAHGPNTVLFQVECVLRKAGIDEFIFDMMKNDIVRGNFSVMYLDDRIVGNDKARIKAKKELDRIRTACVKMQQEGHSLSQILII